MTIKSRAKQNKDSKNGTKSKRKERAIPHGIEYRVSLPKNA
jgi:hypothetical protein